jgi:hypothetical protein
MDKVPERAWQRPLKGNRLETFVAMNGYVLHMHADVVATDALLATFEAYSGTPVPPMERRKPLYGRRRAAKPLVGQLSIDDMLV